MASRYAISETHTQATELRSNPGGKGKHSRGLGGKGQGGGQSGQLGQMGKILQDWIRKEHRELGLDGWHDWETEPVEPYTGPTS